MVESPRVIYCIKKVNFCMEGSPRVPYCVKKAVNFYMDKSPRVLCYVKDCALDNKYLPKSELWKTMLHIIRSDYLFLISFLS